MNGLPKLAAGAALALTLGALTLAGPARADSWREDCFGSSGCVREHCDNDGFCTRANSFGEATRPSRYACDADGDDCHWTRSYYLNADGDPVFDPGMSDYP